MFIIKAVWSVCNFKLLVLFQTSCKLFGCHCAYFHFIYPVTRQRFRCCVKPNIIFMRLGIHHDRSFKKFTYINPGEFCKQSNQPPNQAVFWFFLKIIPLFSQLKWFVYTRPAYSQPRVVYFLLKVGH